MKLAELRYQAQAQLVAGHAVEADVLKESQLNLEARRRELRAAEAQFDLAQAALKN